MSYHFKGDYDDQGQPNEEGWGNCTLHVHAHVLQDEEGVHVVEAMISDRLTKKYGVRTKAILINWKWMGD